MYNSIFLFFTLSFLDDFLFPHIHKKTNPLIPLSHKIRRLPTNVQYRLMHQAYLLRNSFVSSSFTTGFSFFSVLVYFGNKGFLQSQWQEHPQANLGLISASNITLFFKNKLAVSVNHPYFQRHLPCSIYQQLFKMGRYLELKKGGIPQEPRK